MALRVPSHAGAKHPVTGLVKHLSGEFQIIVIVLEVWIVEDLVLRRSITDCGNSQSAEAEINHALLVDRVSERPQEVDVSEPSIAWLGHAVMHVMAQVAVEREE